MKKLQQCFRTLTTAATVHTVPCCANTRILSRWRAAIGELIVMPEVPFQLHYALTRRQRIGPHLRIWFPLMPGVVGALAVGVFIAVGKWWLFPVLLLSLWLLRGFWIGLLDVAIHPVKQMDIIIEQNGLGFMMGGERFWIFLDGMIRIERLCSDTWTFCHHNGHVINVPISVITEDQVDFIRQAAAKGKTPEGVRAVIERGRKIQQMEIEARKARHGKA